MTIDTVEQLQELQDALNESNRHHGAMNGALVIALIDKGVLTKKEFDKAYAQAIAIVDQESAKHRDQGET